MKNLLEFFGILMMTIKRKIEWNRTISGSVFMAFFTTSILKMSFFSFLHLSKIVWFLSKMDRLY